MNTKPWQKPTLQILDTVVELTGSFDKIGSAWDAASETIQSLDGDIVQDS